MIMPCSITDGIREDEDLIDTPTDAQNELNETLREIARCAGDDDLRDFYREKQNDTD